MRFKKQKRHRKTVRFYTACFGFREPFKVLCDGTFVHHLVSNHLSPETTVSNILGASVQLFTTKCIIEELKSLGKSHAESYRVARRDYKLARFLPRCFFFLVLDIPCVPKQHANQKKRRLGGIWKEGDSGAAPEIPLKYFISKFQVIFVVMVILLCDFLL